MQRQNVNVNEAYQKIIAALRTVRWTWRWLTFSEGVLMCIGILACTMTGALVCFALPLPRWLRIAIILLGIGIGIWTLVWFLLRPLRRKLTDATVAAHLEKTEPAFQSRILSAVQLKGTLAENQFGYAPEFVEQLIFETAREVERIQPKQVFASEHRHIKRNAGVAGLAMGILLLTHFLWLPTAFKGFAQTFQAIPKTPQEVLNVQISDVHPGNINVEPGTDVTITANVSGHLGAPVALYYRIGSQETNRDREGLPMVQDQEVSPTRKNRDQEVSPTEGSRDREGSPTWHSLEMHRSLTEILYSATIENVDRALQYYITSKEVASEKYQIRVNREPGVKQFQMQLNSPAYTQLPPQTLEANVGDIYALFGTEVVFTGDSNKPLASAYLDFEESEDVSLEITESGEIGARRGTGDGTATRIDGTFIAKKSENYSIRLIDAENGLTNRNPIRYTVNVIKDAAPDVDIIEPARDSVLDDAMFVEIKVEATDDYGIQALQLVYRVEREDAVEVNVPLKQWEPLAAQQSVFVTYTWDVDAVGMFPGETLAYYVQALDTDNISGPNVGKSLTYTLRFPSLSEMYDEISAEQQTEQHGIEELFDEQAEAAGLVDTLLDKIRKSQRLTLKDENLMQQVLETQEQIEEAAMSLVEDMKKTAADMEKNQLFDQETLQKYQELQELMEEALSEEHKELLRKLSEALATQELTEQEKALMEANLNQEQFLQQLERAKSLYEQLLLQQELEAAVKQSAALAEQQKELMDTLTAIEEGTNAPQEGQPTDTPQSLAQKEDRVGSEVSQLQEKLDSLGAEMGKLAEKQESDAMGAPPQIGRLAEEIERLNQFAREHQLTETLQDTSANLRSGQNQQALQSGREAEQTLTELAQGLDNALEFMEGANADAAQAAMRQAVTSALHLSHLHEKVLEETQALSAATTTENPVDGEIKQMQQLAAEELSASEGLERLATQLWELGTRQMEVEPEIVWRLNASNDALSRAARALEDRQPGLAVPIQRAALADMNAAIFQLLNAMAQMNQQMGASGLENMMEQLQQLAQGQEQLNQMAQNLNQQLRQQGQTPGLQEMLRQLAGQQQLIREATERLAEMAEQMAEMLGSLKDVAEDMTEVEKSLQQGEINRQVLDRQEQILTRMLDSLKSLQKRDVGKQRKAQVAKNPSTPAQEVPPLHPDLLEIVRKLETAPNATEVENIPFQYREQLRQYFKRLSQRSDN